MAGLIWCQVIYIIVKKISYVIFITIHWVTYTRVCSMPLNRNIEDLLLDIKVWECLYLLHVTITDSAGDRNSWQDVSSF